VREIKHLSIHQWLHSAIPDSQQPTSPIGFLFLKLPPPPCAALLVVHYTLIYTNIDLVEKRETEVYVYFSKTSKIKKQEHIRSLR